MFKPVIVANKSWWVPLLHSQALAVELSDPKDYRQAVEDKVLRLLEQAGEGARDQVEAYLGPQVVESSLDPEDLMWAVLGHLRVAERIQEGDPLEAEPAPEEDARAAVAAQPDLELAAFLEG